MTLRTEHDDAYFNRKVEDNAVWQGLEEKPRKLKKFTRYELKILSHAWKIYAKEIRTHLIEILSHFLDSNFIIVTSMSQLMTLLHFQ